VAAVALDLPVAIASTENAAWNHLAGWPELGFTGSGVNVALLDTGVDTGHVDLAERIIDQHCFDRTENCPPADTDESERAQDENGHGTHVAGIIISQGQTSPGGLAPEAGVVAVRVLGSSGTGFTSDVVAGIDWVVANQASLKVKVMNLSLGGGSYEGVCDGADANTMLYAAAAAAARQAGITIFAASGNRGLTDQMMAPACVSGIVSVGNVYQTDFGSFSWPTCLDTVTALDQVPCSSNSSAVLDVLAPGVQITSTRLGGGQSIQSGTSMSTAFASGVAALMSEAKPSLTPLELETALKETGLPVTDSRNDRVTPRIDAVAALDRVSDGQTTAISGTILLQGRTDHGKTQLSLSESPCSSSTTGSTSLAVTDVDGRFEITLPAGHNYRCLQAKQPGYLAGQAELPPDDVGVTTLPAGDVTGDQRIDIFDLALMGNRFGQNDPVTDLNADGIVNIIDLALAAVNYKKSGPVTLGLDAAMYRSP
jgi:subtilisin family serine protease